MNFLSDLRAAGFGCPDCRNGKLRRLGRVGFLQTRVLARIGIYPWECPLCRRLLYFRTRSRLQQAREVGD
ncbi:MAG TPA: hypothetical protein VGR64_01330 [Terracidiphilus sp.]|nr:hypothetical protein [Terracidiphilus sp.]